MLVVNGNTSAEHLYVGMTRGRAENLACVITDPVGDEHSRGKVATASEILAACLQRTSSELTATETLRKEHGQLPEPATRIEVGLREAQQHSFRETVRCQTRQRASTATPAITSLEPSRITPDL